MKASQSLPSAAIPCVPGRRATGRWSATAMLLVLATGCGPLGPVSGGALTGEVAEWPSNFAFTREIDTIQLQTNPDDPYSVNVWGLGIAGDFYVASGDPRNRWAQNMEAAPEVVLGIDGRLYPALAVRVTDARELDRVLTAYNEKYEVDSEEPWVETAWVFRLRGRSGS